MGRMIAVNVPEKPLSPRILSSGEDSFLEAARFFAAPWTVRISVPHHSSFLNEMHP